MYEVKITTVKGIITIYIDNILKLEKELNKYPEHEKVEVTKVLKKTR